MAGEFIYLQTADGLQLFVPDQDIKFLTYGNFGAPPVDFITRRGYRQHGATEVDYLLQPRTVTAQLWHTPACSRQLFWDNRLALHEYLRHNRGGPILFVLRQPNGQERALIVRANPGLVFPMPGTDGPNNWAVDEPIDFLAHDPIWFDPVLHSELIASTVDNNLVFPITFPITFGSSGFVSTTTVTYTGTWRTYPVITLYGPYTQAIIENVTTGTVIFMMVAVAGGDRRILSLKQGEQSIVDQFGNSRFDELGEFSDLVDFAVWPDPEVPGGVQVFKCTFFGGIAGTTAMKLEFNTRWFAL